MASTEYIRNVDGAMLNTASENTVRRVNKCLENGGGHFEHYMCFLYCDHQVYRDFLIALYNMAKVRKRSIAKPLIQIISKWSQSRAICYKLNIHITKFYLYINYITLNITLLLLLLL
jgi:hypothetical protein